MSTATTTVAPPITLSKFRLFLLFLAPFLIVGGLWLVPAMWYYRHVTASSGEVATAEPDGVRLFAKHCAHCHGENGDGKGPALLNPAARHFGYEPFKFATTYRKTEMGYSYATPTDADLVAVLKRGIPGSSMPAFQRPPEGVAPATQVYADLSDAELTALAEHVRQLARKGVSDKLFEAEVVRQLKDITGESTEEKANAAANEKDRQDARREAAKQLPAVATATANLTVIGSGLPIPEVPPATADSLANGRRLFVSATCASCHGPGGKGDGEQLREPPSGQPDKRPRNDNGTLAYPRDLTSGVYKGGGSAKDIYARLRLGIPGSPMPATPLDKMSEQDAFDLIRYVQSLKGTP